MPARFGLLSPRIGVAFGPNREAFPRTVFFLPFCGHILLRRSAGQEALPGWPQATEPGQTHRCRTVPAPANPPQFEVVFGVQSIFCKPREAWPAHLPWRGPAGSRSFGQITSCKIGNISQRPTALLIKVLAMPASRLNVLLTNEVAQQALSKQALESSFHAVTHTC